MRVAIIIDTWFPLIGGGQINAWEISKRLAQKGIKIDLITRNNGKDSLPRIKNLNIYKIGSKKNSQDSISKILFIFKSANFIASRNYDLVQAHAFLPGFTLKLLSIIKKYPTIYTVHGTSLFTNLNNIISKYLEILLLTKIKYSAEITVSRDFLTLKNINNNVVHIPNGVNIKYFDKVVAKKNNYPSLLFVGRLHPQKNLAVLINALPILISKWPKLKLTIVGKGQLKRDLINSIKQLRITDYVDFKGEMHGNKLIKIYKSSHLLLLPSIYEGQPLVVLEAWAAKLPVVVSKTGDCQYMVKNGLNGYIFKDQLSFESIAHTIGTALSNKNLSKLGQRGYDYVNKDLTWENAANKTLNTYKKLLNEHESNGKS